MSPLLITLAVLRGRVSCWGGSLSKDFKATVQGNSDEETCSKDTLRRENFPGGNPLQWWMQDAGKGENETGGECRSGTSSNLLELQGLQRSTCSKVRISDLRHTPCVCPLRSYRPAFLQRNSSSKQLLNTHCLSTAPKAEAHTCLREPLFQPCYRCGIEDPA